jgi:predicted ATP-grasp superfamily ATP-dependent carboligase
MIDVWILGASHHNTYSILKCFGEAGIKANLAIYGCTRSYIGSSKYANSVSYFQSAENLLAWLLQKELDKSKDVIISCTDEIAHLLDESYDSFKNRCRFFNAAQKGQITHWMNKFVQVEGAKECGFDAPQTLLVELPITKDVSFNTFPCIVKPLESIDGGKQIAICKSQNELNSALSDFHCSNVLVQEFVRKDYEIVILGLTVDGETTIPGYIKKHRDLTGGTTYSTVYSSESLLPSLIFASKKLVAKINYSGLWGIECIVRNGKYFFVEINLRNDATTYSLAVAGANLPMEYVRLATVESAKLNQQWKIANIDSMVELNDFVHVLKRNVSLTKWVREYRNSKCKYCLSRKDFIPSVQQVFGTIFSLIKIAKNHVLHPKH